MKKILTILFLSISVAASAQFDQKQTMGTSKTNVISKGLFSADSATVITNWLDTTTANRGYIKTVPGAHIKTADNKEFYRNTTATAWIYIPDFIKLKSTINDSLNTLNMSLENGGPPGFDLFRQKNDSTIQGRSIYFPFGLIGDTTSFGDSVFAIKPDTAWFSSLYIRRADSAGYYITPKRLADTAAAIRAAIGTGGITALSPWPYNINGAQHRLDSVKALRVGVAGTGVTENLMPNSEDLDNATYWGASDITVTADQALDATGAMTMDELNITLSGSNLLRTANLHPVDVVTGDTYYLTMDTKRGTLSSGVYNVRDVDNAADIIFTTLTIPAGATSTFTSPSFVIPPGCTHLYIYPARDVSGTGTYYIGRVQVHHLGNTYVHTTTGPSPAAGSGGYATAISTDSVTANVGIGQESDADYKLAVTGPGLWTIGTGNSLTLGNFTTDHTFISSYNSGGNGIIQMLADDSTTDTESVILISPQTGGIAIETDNPTTGAGNTIMQFLDSVTIKFPGFISTALYYKFSKDTFQIRNLPAAVGNKQVRYNTATGRFTYADTTAAGYSLAIGNTITSATAGSVLFAGTGGKLMQKNSDFFYDSTNKRLGIGTATPSEALQVVGNMRFSGALMPNNAAGTSGQVLTSAGAGAPPTWGPLLPSQTGKHGQHLTTNGTAASWEEMSSIQSFVGGGTFALSSIDYIWQEITGSGSTSLTLPTAVGNSGRLYGIKNTGGGTVTFTTTSSQTIDGASTLVVSALKGVALVQSNGANWVILYNSASGSSQWTTTGSDIYYNTGNVGIGSTSAPTDKLHIRGASSNGLTIEGSQPMLTLNATSNDPQITLTRGGNSSNMYVNSGTQLIIQGYNEVKVQQSGTTGFGIFSYVGGSFNSAFSIGSTAGPTSTLQTYGSFATAYAAKTGTYTATDYDHTIDCTSGTFTVTLPTAAGITGREYSIKNTGAGVITVGTTSSQNIDVATTYTLPAIYKYVTVQSTGSAWIVVANN